MISLEKCASITPAYISLCTILLKSISLYCVIYYIIRTIRTTLYISYFDYR